MTSSLRPRLWQRKTPPTGTASRWRLKLRRDREIHTHPNNHLSHADNHLPYTHTPFRSAKKRHTHIATLKLLSHSTQVQSSQGEFIYEARTHRFASEDFRIHTASDTFSLQRLGSDEEKLHKNKLYCTVDPNICCWSIDWYILCILLTSLCLKWDEAVFYK